ncbi:tetratricopeptide repeat protein [Roseococcus pinisoli]|uniref:protein O-GlcNAc transferase n=1 Tax=Roseococcus pinisoli TaxID=2835040 RepID=A0ABS5QCY9_9PROT|nr:tetratricopeptide repeat protein [Roseococcus pinisoli]MBS7811374.1 tetratricopeptide repeat protein [Roseococcus pinisoli]
MSALAEFDAGLDALRAGRTEAAIPLLASALVQEPVHALAALNLGMALMDLGRLEDAAPHLRQAAAALPHVPEVHFRLGRLAHLRGDGEVARKGYDAALAREPGHVASLAGLAVLERRAGAKARAEALMAEALLHAPEDSGLELEYAQILRETGAEDRAAAVAEAVMAREPGLGQAGLVWVDALVASQGAAEARLRIEAALALDPLSAARVAGLASLIETMEGGVAALPHWRLAEALAPEDGQILSGLGHCLWRQRLHPEALDLFQRAVRLLPNERKLRVALGDQLFRVHRFAEAATTLQGAMRDWGSDYRAQATLGLVQVSQGLHDEAIAAATAAGGENEMLLRLCGIGPYHPELADAAILREVADHLHDALSGDLPPAVLPPREPRPRLRVGFLSPHFGTHPVGWFTLAGIEHLPRDGFEVILLSLGERAGPHAQRFRDRADRWVVLDPSLGDLPLVERLRAEELDVLVELGGHGLGGRVRALRHRCAPVQIKWVGSQSASTGVPNIDWMLTDRWETPEGFEPYYLERLLRLPDGYVCYDPPAAAPEIAPAPWQRRGYVTFGCYNNLAKVTSRVLACWARILEAVPSSRLVLRTHALGDAPTREAFVARAEALGLPRERMDLHGAIPHAELLAAYGDIDISLDPFPYNGGLTVCESLWMGVPVLTLVGGSFAARHALSHLSNVGLPDWVTFDEQEYVAQAVARAAAPEKLATLRASLRGRVAASPLCDAPRFGRGLADALRRAAQAAFA